MAIVFIILRLNFKVGQASHSIAQIRIPVVSFRLKRSDQIDKSPSVLILLSLDAPRTPDASVARSSIPAAH